MASRATRQLLSTSVRSSRTTLSRSTWQSLKTGAGRRGMSSTAGEAAKGSDMPWIIGSVVVFGPAFLYLASPSTRKSAPHKPHKSESHAPVTMEDDEGKEADVTDSIAKAKSEDAPQSDGASDEGKSQASTPQTDDNKAPPFVKTGDLKPEGGSSKSEESSQGKDKEQEEKEAVSEEKAGAKARSHGSPSDKAATETTKQDPNADVPKAQEEQSKKEGA
ncbi:hypothetical protein AAF712_003759 [Marasmius tenuissimus]|uniref:Uncharacterized protein n=1 Tax=Marasmius tenuissimus TaxID=585030 RepID=A0ABR3A5Y5_9AGAR